MIEVCITAGPLPLARLRDREASEASGAIVTFSGIVRNRNNNRPVTALDYDCAPALAENCLRQIAEEARTRWETEHIVIHHGHGLIAIGQASVFILVASTKRDAAFEASRYIIEEMKQRVPVWKREIYADGETCWLEGTPLPEAGGCA